MNFNSINGLLNSFTKVAIAKPYTSTSTFRTNDINDMLKSFELISEIVYESSNSITTTFSSRDKSDISESENTKSKINNDDINNQFDEEDEEDENEKAPVESSQQNDKNTKPKWKNYKCKEIKKLVFDGTTNKSQINCDESDKKEKNTFTTVEISNRYVNPKKTKDENDQDNENDSDTIFELYADKDLKIIKKSKPKPKK